MTETTETTIETRFRRVALEGGKLTVVCPVRRSASGDHQFLSYWDARALLADAIAAADAAGDTRHRVVGYAEVEMQVVDFRPVAAAASEKGFVPDELIEAREAAAVLEQSTTEVV